jgi:hypothetical protein
MMELKKIILGVSFFAILATGVFLGQSNLISKEAHAASKMPIIQKIPETNWVRIVDKKAGIVCYGTDVDAAAISCVRL